MARPPGGGESDLLDLCPYRGVSVQSFADFVAGNADIGSPRNYTGHRGKAHSDDANTLGSLVQQIAMTLGVAAAAFGLQASRAVRGPEAMAAVDFQVAFVGVALCAVAALLFYARLPAESGREVSGHSG